MHYHEGRVQQIIRKKNDIAKVLAELCSIMLFSHVLVGDLNFVLKKFMMLNTYIL